MPISRVAEVGSLTTKTHHLCHIHLHTHPSGRSSAQGFKMQAVSIQNLPMEVLKKGLLVDGNKLIRLDCENRMCIELFARALTIVWGDTKDYWTYKLERLSGSESIEVAELLNVCWLEVQGQLDTSMLSPCTEYEVLFDVKMAPGAYGFTKPVKFTLTTPSGHKIESERRINDGINEIPIGKFHPRGGNKVGFRLYELNPQWKRGLIIQGVIIRAVGRNVYID